jgi:hypothetical protein
MNLAQQRRVIAVSAMLVFAIGFLAKAEEGELPTARFLIGTGGIFTLVSVFADFGSPIGAGMAIVVLLTATLTQGEKALALLTRRAGGYKKPLRGGRTGPEPIPNINQPAPNIVQRVNDFEQENPLGLPKVKLPGGGTTILRPPKYSQP